MNASGEHASQSYRARKNTPERAARSLEAQEKEARNARCQANALETLAYAYDGTPEGLLTAVLKAYSRHEVPIDIAPSERIQARLGQTVRDIETDLSAAQRVRRGLVRAAGEAAFRAVVHASLSDEPDAGTAAYRFVRYALRTGEKTGYTCQGCPKRHSCTDVCQAPRGDGALSHLAHPEVERLAAISRAVSNERHRMLQFIRFEQLENGVWFARCNPNASVVPLIMDHFSARLNVQAFMIYDEVHGMAGVYEGDGWRLVRTDSLHVPARSENEKLMRAAWKRFYDTVAVESRYHPELRRQFMPKRLWRNITELQESAHGNAPTSSHPAMTQALPLEGSDCRTASVSRDAAEGSKQRHRKPPRKQVSAASHLYDGEGTPVKSNAGMKLSSAAPPSCQK